jgi:hypothetical protein
MGHWRRQGKTVVFVTNRLEFVGQSDSVLVIDRGSIVAHGTPDEVGTLYHCLSMSACFSSHTRRSCYPLPLPFHVCMFLISHPTKLVPSTTAFPCLHVCMFLISHPTKLLPSTTAFPCLHVSHLTPDEVGTLHHRLSMSACFSPYTRRSWYPLPQPFHVCMFLILQR